jgi:predicted PurR-regulated permease PerM
MIHREKDTVISITAGTILKGIAILIGFYIAYLLRDLLLVIVVSVVLASSIEPAIKFRIHRIPAVLAIYLALVGFMAGVFYAFIPPLVDELYNFSQNLPTVAKELNVNFFRSDTSTVKKSETILTKITGNASPLQDISAGIGKVSTVSQNALGAATAIFGGVFSFILIVVLSFYFAMQEKGIEDFLRVIIPFDKEAYVISLWARSQAKIGKWMQGQLLLGVMIFVLVYLGLTIFGIPYALMLAALAGILEIIPVFGPIMSAIPGVVLAFSIGGTSLALVIAGFYLLVQQFESNLIYPLVVRKIVGVPPILVILALIVGAELGGFLGILISVPVAAVIMEIVEDVEKGKNITA